ncbi:HPP family protein [Cyclobacterium sp. SYSU L10401]|uniref:HPP family protein n=1 Tax=Cyclobacterium sp. SYSU L10401 TaxID=2678657 RepID=UPI0013D521FF|nr:HPP family protein [Cyclobacterium sp. SYSU L10401]
MKWSIGLTPAQAVALSILAMQYSKTLHSSEGAIALIANTGSSEIREMSCFYVINAVLTGVIILIKLVLGDLGWKGSSFIYDKFVVNRKSCYFC